MKFATLFFRSCYRISPSKITSRLYHQNNLCEDYALATEANIKDVLQECSVPFTDGHTCLQVKNCFCTPSTLKISNSVDVFINKQTGYFTCHNCKIAGDWALLKDLMTKAKEDESHLEDFKQNCEKLDKIPEEWLAVEENSECLSYMKDSTCDKIFTEFKLTRCPRSVIEELKIRISLDKTSLYFPLFCSGSVVGFKTFNKSNEETTSPRVNTPGLLISSKPMAYSTSAVVVANIPDFLALTSLRLKNCDIVCLPYGTRYLPQTSLPFFEKYDKIILWLGVGCLDVIGNFANKLSQKRCYIIKPAENQKNASLALAKKENINQILSNAKLAYHQFVTTFSSFREDVFAQLLNQAPSDGVPWKKFPQLTNILKGHRRGELTILTGPTGVGKTTFLSEYSLDLAMQGVNTLWGSFEVKNIRLAKIMLTQFAGSPLPTTASEYNTLCDKFEQVPMFFLTFHGQQNIEQVMDALYHCSYTYDIAHVLIDNVQFMIDVSLDAYRMDRFHRQDYMIQMFRHFASKYNCHVTLVMHPKKTEASDLAINSIFGGAKASQEADNIFIIQSRSVNSYKHQKYLEVVKNRYHGDLGAFPLIFDKPSLSFSLKSSSKQPLEFYNNPEQNNDDFEDDLDDLKNESVESYYSNALR